MKQIIRDSSYDDDLDDSYLAAMALLTRKAPNLAALVDRRCSYLDPHYKPQWGAPGTDRVWHLRSVGRYDDGTPFKGADFPFLIAEVVVAVNENMELVWCRDFPPIISRDS